MFRKPVKFLTIILMMLIMASKSNGKETTKSIYVLSVKSTSNPDYFKIFQIKTSGNQTKFDLSAEVIKTMPPNLIFFFAAKLNPQAGYGSRPLFRHEIKFCDLFGERKLRMTSFITSWVHDFLLSTNAPMDCPPTKGNYSWNNLSLGNINLPKYFPSAKYEITGGSYLPQKSGKIMFSEFCILLKVD